MELFTGRHPIPASSISRRNKMTVQRSVPVVCMSEGLRPAPTLRDIPPKLGAILTMTLNMMRPCVGQFICLTIALLLAGCSQQPAASTSEPAKTVAVKAVAVVEQDVQRTTVQPATVHAYFQAEIEARASGYLRELKVDIGDYVEAGDVLAVIDVPEMQKQREIIEARIARFEAEQQRSEAGVNLAKSHIRSVEAKLEQAKFELDRADASLVAVEAEFSRTQDLVERQSLERRMLDEARKKRDSELANKDAVSSAIVSAEADVAVAKSQLVSAEADVRAAESETNIAKRQLDELNVMVAYATIKAPFAGVVTMRTVDPGDLVRAESDDSEPLFIVSQVDKLRVHMPVPEVDAPAINRGDKVSLSFPSFPSEDAVHATVTRVSGSLDASTRTMLVEAELPNPDRKLLPGMFGQATITLATKVATNVLPARAIRFDEAGQAYVYVVGEDEKVSIVNITTGLDDGISIEVLSGVTAGERVVDAHLKRFTTGQQVTLLTP